jgi:hypothetical protein
MRTSFTPGGVELSERKVQEMSAALHGDDPMGRRSALRVPVEGFVTIVPLTPGGGHAAQRRVGVYDLSRSGIAVVDAEPIEAGSQFNIQIARESGMPIEVLCTARHSRRQGEAYITGAEFGVSWLSALGAAVSPGMPGS